MNKKVINLAIAMPGTGKTKAALAAIPGMLCLGKKILYVSPTLALADQLFTDIIKLDSAIKPMKIDSRNGGLAEVTLNKMLNPDEDAYVIICQHANFQRCSTTHLRHWTVIIDELPMPMNLRHFTFDETQLKRIDLIENVSGQIKIKPNTRELLKKEISIFQRSNLSNNNKVDSTLAAPTQDIYKALLDNNPVFADSEKYKNSANDNSDQKTVIRIIEEYGYFERFHAAREVHLLSATLPGSLFDWFAKAHGFTYMKSYFAPSDAKNEKNVTIYPMLSDNNDCSRGVLDSVDASSDNGQKVLQSITRLIDSHLGPEEKCLMFAYEWGQHSHSNKFQQCRIDSRGLNHLTDTHCAFTAFHGNPNPIARRSLEYIAKKYDRPTQELFTSWKFTHKYEMTLQNVFRTSLRTNAIDKPVKLYVQDIETARFLQSTYLGNATIDESLARTYKAKQKPGPKPSPAMDRAIVMLEAGMKQAQVARETKLSKMTISKYAKTLKTTRTVTSQPVLTNTLEAWM